LKVTSRGSFDLTRRFGSVDFSGVAVPETALLGGPGDATTALRKELEVACVLLCAESVAAMDTMLDQTVEYSKQRMQFGRPIGSFQAIKHRLADLYALSLSSRAAAYYAVLAVADDMPDAPEAVAIAKNYVSDAFVKSAHE